MRSLDSHRCRHFRIITFSVYILIITFVLLTFIIHCEVRGQHHRRIKYKTVNTWLKTFSLGMLLCVFTAGFLRRQEVHDEICSFPGPLQRHRVTAVLQHLHLAVWQRRLQHRRPRNVHHLRHNTGLSAAWYVCGFWLHLQWSAEIIVDLLYSCPYYDRSAIYIFIKLKFIELHPP